MKLFQAQFEDLRVKYPNAVCTELPSGAQLIEIPNFKLPSGWNRQEVIVYFLAPPGYPAAQPDCFWTDQPFLRLENSVNPPQNTNEANAIPEVGQKGTWFSWHLQSWNPNKDCLETYVNVIRQRLDPAR